jgi:hypothetical protein
MEGMIRVAIGTENPTTFRPFRLRAPPVRLEAGLSGSESTSIPIRCQRHGLEWMDSDAAKGPCPCGASVAGGGRDSYIKVFDRSAPRPAGHGAAPIAACKASALFQHVS